jgi:hypothetical protein
MSLRLSQAARDRLSQISDTITAMIRKFILESIENSSGYEPGPWRWHR